MRCANPGQWGTHVDPDAHLARGRRTLDEIPMREMVLPLVVLDIRWQVQSAPDYCIKLDDVASWERSHGAYATGRLCREAQRLVGPLAFAAANAQSRRRLRAHFLG